MRLAEEGEAALDDDLRLGPGDQRPVVHLQEEPTEAPLAEDVGERLAPEAPPDELVQPLGLEGGHRAARRVELGAREPEHVRDENLGVDARRGHSRCAEPAFDLVDGIQGHHTLFAADSHVFLTPPLSREPAAAPRRRGLP